MTSQQLRRGGNDGQPEQIEDYPPGYPRFSALIASHDSFHLCRRFSGLRARLLLLKQDKLAQLEEQLEKADRDEAYPLSLGSCRRDSNNERRSILSDIDAALADYDAFLERNHRILSFEPVSRRAVSNLQNWVDGNGCVAREETAYLGRGEDLCSVATSGDGVVMWLEELLGDIRVYLHKHLGEPRNHQRGISRDPNVHIFPPSSMRRLARIAVAPIVVGLLLIPVLICNLVGNFSTRLAVVVATTSFVAVLSSVTKPRTIDLFIAGAIYATVLVVFISNTNATPS